MTNLLPGPIRSFVMVSCCALLAGCAAPENDPSQASQDSAPQPNPALEIAAALASPDAGPPPEAPATAEIMDVVQASSGNEWAVAVRFGQGETGARIIEVGEKRAGKLLAKDEVPDAANSSEIHETRFTYRGQRENLVIRVTDKAGDVLAQWGQ